MSLEDFESVPLCPIRDIMSSHTSDRLPHQRLPAPPNPEGRRWEDATPVTMVAGGRVRRCPRRRCARLGQNELRGRMNLSSGHHGSAATLRDFLQAVPHLVPEQVRHGDLSGQVRR